MYERSISDPNLKRPLSSIALHPAETTGSGSALYELIKLYADRKIYSTYGLSLTDYLELPHDIATFIMSDCTTRIQKDFNTTSSILDELQNPKIK